MAQLVVDGSPEDVDLVRALQRQAITQQTTLDEQKRQSQIVIRTDFLGLKSSLEHKIDGIVDRMQQALDAMSERIAICE